MIRSCAVLAMQNKQIRPYELVGALCTERIGLAGSYVAYNHERNILFRIQWKTSLLAKPTTLRFYRLSQIADIFAAIRNDDVAFRNMN